jgi:hypothetical protein
MTAQSYLLGSAVAACLVGGIGRAEAANYAVAAAGWARFFPASWPDAETSSASSVAVPAAVPFTLQQVVVELAFSPSFGAVSSSVTEDVTIDGETHSITIAEQDDVEAAGHTFSFAAAPVYFAAANVYLSIQPQFDFDSTVGDSTFPITALITPAPEPASLAVLGVGLLGLVVARKRRKVPRAG